MFQDVKKQNVINKNFTWNNYSKLDSFAYNQKLSSLNNISFGGPKKKKDLIIQEVVISSLSMLNETN